MRKRQVVGPDGMHTFQYQQLRCGDCRHFFDLEMEVDVPVTRWVEAMRQARCPACGSKNLMMEQGRTLAEDARFAGTGSIEQRAALWQENGELGGSSDSIRRHMLGIVDDELTAPSDLFDLRRCVLLLVRIPEWQERLPEMGRHQAWSRIAAEWPSLWTTFFAEAGPGLEGYDLPRTRELLQALR